MVKSYIQLLQTIELFCSAHMQIKRFASDFETELTNYLTQNEAYPVLTVSPASTIFQENVKTFTIIVKCFDVITKDRTNINTILSDTALILQDLEIWLREGQTTVDIIDISTLTPINNSQEDYLAGWQLTINVMVGNYTLCEIPFSGNPIVSSICNNVVYDTFLTCVTLPNCPVIQEIQDDIVALEARPDVYVTGGTFSSSASTIVFTNNTGGTFNVTGITVTGGTSGGGGGSPVFFDWRFDSITVSGDPGVGDFRFDATTGIGITRIYIDSINNEGDDMDFYFSKLIANEWNIFIQQKDDDTKRGQFLLTGTPINNTGWWSLPVQFISSNGNPPVNNKVCTFAFQKTSDAELPFVNTATTININGNQYDLSTNREWRVAQADTGALSYNGAVYNSPTTIDIGAADGYVIDNETNPLEPSYVRVIYTGQTNVTVPTLSSGTASYVLLKSDGTIHFQNTLPSSAERKGKIYLSKIGHPEGLITFVVDEVDFITSPLAQFRDVFQAITYINLGIQPYANTGLTFNTTGGSIIGDGINFVNDNTNPNTLTVTATSPTTFVYRNQTGGTETATTLLDPTQYDASGVTTTVPAGYTTIQYVYFAPGAGFAVQRGQFTYSSFTEAINSVGREAFVTFSNFVQNATLIGVIVMQQNGTDVTDTTKFRFLKSNKFGEIISTSSGAASGGGGSSTLQEAYNNSASPQIQTDAVNGALKIQGHSPSGSTTFEALNSIGDTVFAINEAGRFSGVSMVRTITTTNTRGIDMLMSNTGTTSNAIYVANRNDSINASAVRIDNFSGGTGLFITNTTASGKAMQVNGPTNKGLANIGGQNASIEITGGLSVPALAINSIHRGLYITMNSSAIEPAINIDSNLSSSSPLIFQNNLSSVGTNFAVDRLGSVTANTLSANTVISSFINKENGLNNEYLMASGDTKEYHFAQSVTYALSSTTAMQKLGDFGNSGLGSFLLKSGTTYSIKMNFAIQALGASNTTVNLGFLGSSSQSMRVVTVAAKVGTLGTANASNINGGISVGFGGALPLTPVGTAANIRVTVDGIIITGPANNPTRFIPAIALGSSAATPTVTYLDVEIREIMPTDNTSTEWFGNVE